MKSLILAAGLGSRIPEISQKKPKCLILINKKTILKRQIDIMRKKNISDIGIITGFKRNKIKFSNIKYFYNKNFKNNEQLESLMIAKNFLNDDIIITFSDIIYDENILEYLIKSKNDFSIAVDKNWKSRYKNRIDHPYSQADKVLIKKKKILKIGKDVPMSYANGEFLGMLKISKSFCHVFCNYYEKIRKKSLKMQLHNFIQYLIHNKIKISPCYVNGKFMEIDTFNDLQIAKKMFL
jgi:choline kinase